MSHIECRCRFDFSFIHDRYLILLDRNAEKAEVYKHIKYFIYQKRGEGVNSWIFQQWYGELYGLVQFCLVLIHR